MPSLNVIGAGQVGQPLARLLTEKLGLQIHSVLGRSFKNTQSACDFIGQGKPITRLPDLSPADYTLIAVPDTALQSIAEALSTSHPIQKGALFFHCSGSISSSILSMIQEQGGITASLHPVKSFVDTQHAYHTFEGTPCALEGDEAACEILDNWMTKLGAKPFKIQPDKKLIYHSSLVFACNYLVSLSEIAFLGLKEAGIQRDAANSLLRPFMENTLAQLLEKGTAKALSGPIARGEFSIVKAEIEALAAWKPNIATLYKALGEIALLLAEEKGTLTAKGIDSLQQILRV
jgi:predicted short-subunit dehydrogenase-like oxidoreductase (DUF2520 family)